MRICDRYFPVLSPPPPFFSLLQGKTRNICKMYRSRTLRKWSLHKLPPPPPHTHTHNLRCIDRGHQQERSLRHHHLWSVIKSNGPTRASTENRQLGISLLGHGAAGVCTRKRGNGPAEYGDIIATLTAVCCMTYPSAEPQAPD